MTMVKVKYENGQYFWTEIASYGNSTVFKQPFKGLVGFFGLQVEFCDRIFLDIGYRFFNRISNQKQIGIIR